VLREQLPWGVSGRSWVVPRPRQTPDPGHLRLVCRCDPPRPIYVSRSVEEAGGIQCLRCGSPFRWVLRRDEGG
jgi:hypothetical protein